MFLGEVEMVLRKIHTANFFCFFLDKKHFYYETSLLKKVPPNYTSDSALNIGLACFFVDQKTENTP